MSADRDTTRIVRAWLEHGVTALPDRVLDAVLDELPATPQRRPSLAQWLVGRHTARGFVMAAALVIVLVLLGLTYLVAPRVGAPSPTEHVPAPTAAALPSDGPLRAGAYGLGDAMPVPISFDAPAGLRACTLDDEPAVCGQSIAALGFGTITNVVVEPCETSPTLRDPPVGPSVGDLVTALRQLPGFTVRAQRPIIVDGYQGTELEIVAPGVNCIMSTWSSPQRINRVSPRETNRLRILDVDGTRVVLALAYHPTTPASDMSALEQAMDSVRFDDR